jgi:2-amino-4-hydroxy-6-hydroxymethyldihydropteridine diphosphokinase
MHEIFLGIGGNIGDKKSNFKKTYINIEAGLGRITRRSSVYETPPWGFSAKENFWNQVLLIDSRLSPGELLTEIHKIEGLFRRINTEGKYKSREMDIDILYYDNIFLNTGDMIIPHPLIQQRLFVLVPLNEIAPGFKHPLLRLTSRQLLQDCKDESVIKRVEFNETNMNFHHSKFPKKE